MTRRDAKRYVCAWIAAEARSHASNGSEWLFQGSDGEPHSEADQDRLLKALEELGDELERRGKDAPE